jgi:hypothetical protein
LTGFPTIYSSSGMRILPLGVQPRRLHGPSSEAVDGAKGTPL